MDKPLTATFDNNFINMIQKVYSDKYGFSQELKNFHMILNEPFISDDEKTSTQRIKIIGNDRTSVFYDDYHNFIDKTSFFNDIYHKFISDYVKPLYAVDDKIVVQKTPNLRISFPNTTAIGKHVNENESENVIGLHKDSDFGHHESEVNFIIPLTNMFDTNSIYYEPHIGSGLSTNEFLNLKLSSNEFFICKFNQLLHFNKINDTGVTRMSLDFRIIPYDKYVENEGYFKNTKFELGRYYIVL